MYFVDQYYRFLSKYDIDRKNQYLITAFFPFLIKQYVIENFDQKLMAIIPGVQPKKLYFIIASFLFPKITMKLIE